MFREVRIRRARSGIWCNNHRTAVWSRCLGSRGPCPGEVIYIAAHVPYVHVISCSDCKIVVCAVSRVLSMQHCERVSVHVASSALKLDNCVDCRAYVYCRTPPILTGPQRREAPAGLFVIPT